MTQEDRKHIVRQWNREIEDEIRREAERNRPGPWRAVVWAAMWLVWLGLLVALLAYSMSLR